METRWAFPFWEARFFAIFSKTLLTIEEYQSIIVLSQ